MSLARPAYRFTVTNLDNGWTYTVTAGDPYNPLEPVQLKDGLTMSWSFEDGGPPAQMVPDTIQFVLFCKLATDLPAFDKGDRITAKLVRPLAAGTKPYMEFFGRITDATPEMDPEHGVALELICVDPTSELAATYDFGNNATVSVNILPNVGQAVAANPAAIFWADPTTPGSNAAHYPHEAASIRDHAAKLLNGMQSGIISRVLRAVAPSTAFPVAYYSYPANAEETGPSHNNGRPDAKAAYYPHTWNRGITALAVPLLKFAMSATDADRVELRRNTAADPYAGNADTAYPSVGLSVIRAGVVRAPQQFKLNRGTAPNRAEIAATDGFVGGSWVETVVASEDSTSVKRYGPTTRQIETYLETSTARTKVESYTQYAAPGALWAAETVSLVTEAMTDAELDRYASNFAPLPSVDGFTFRRAIAIMDIDPDVDITNGLLFGVLKGASFVVNGGKLDIQLTIIPAAMYFPNGRGGPTFTAWTASAYGNTYVTDQGGSADYIHPDITFDHFAVSTL